MTRHTWLQGIGVLDTIRSAQCWQMAIWIGAAATAAVAVIAGFVVDDGSGEAGARRTRR